MTREPHVEITIGSDADSSFAWWTFPSIRPGPTKAVQEGGRSRDVEA